MFFLELGKGFTYALPYADSYWDVLKIAASTAFPWRTDRQPCLAVHWRRDAEVLHEISETCKYSHGIIAGNMCDQHCDDLIRGVLRYGIHSLH
jgi:hypothetical protein